MYIVDLGCTDATLDEQAIYWTPEWLAGANETHASFAAGEGITFSNFKEAIHWLKGGN